MSTVFGDPIGLLQDTEDVLRVQRQRYVQRVQEEQETAFRIREACHTSWNKFFAEDNLQCSQLVQSLAAIDALPPLSFADLVSTLDNAEDNIEPHGAGTIALDIWCVDKRHRRTRTVRSVSSVLPSAASRAYPKYESCTPSLQNIKYIGDQRVLAFIPYADEDSFQKLIPKFARCHRWFAWQTEWVDVDIKLAVLNTYLHLEAAGFETAQIERYKPRSMPPASALPELLSALRKRDLPHWASDAFHACRPDRPAAGTDLLMQVQSMNTVFCNHLLCNRAKCFTHEYVAEIVPITQNTKYDDLDKIQLLVNGYRGLNYAFNIEDQAYVLDAATVGNVTRCLNDPRDPDKANAIAGSKQIA
ncbi:hypothetical protein GY45DRAFT_1256604 [Cubamyces sp. BRFM 1775]|nr:hypothetical protein GY45DRAFT_1256604 [Cubamyces sp. BRFM 1775]